MHKKKYLLSITYKFHSRPVSSFKGTQFCVVVYRETGLFGPMGLFFFWVFFLPLVATRKYQRTASLGSSSYNTSNLKPTVVITKITWDQSSVIIFFFLSKISFSASVPPLLSPHPHPLSICPDPEHCLRRLPRNFSPGINEGGSRR